MAWQGRGVATLVVAATISGMAMMNPGPVEGQAGIPSTPAPKAVAGPETNIIPSVTLSERYDSNVFFVPGRNLEDYVTTVSPQLRVVHKRQLVEGTVGGGVTAEAYVKNPGLNYVAANGLIDLNLDGAMNELVRGLGLKISDTYYYTPQPPSFAAPTGGGQLPESFVRGIQAQRANSSTNAGTVAASYAVSPLLSFTSTYRDQRIRFGNSNSTPTGGIQASFIDTTFQTVTSGPVLKVSSIDTLTLYHQYQKGTFEVQGSKSDFSTQGAIAGWTSLVTPTLTASMTGGVVVFSSTNDLQYLGSASLLWKGQDTDLTLSYTRVIAPSFFIAGVPLLSQVVAATATHRVTESFSVLLNGNYAINQSIPDSSLLKFESYSVTSSVQYIVNRVMTATLSYTHSMFDQTFSSQESSFDRNLVMLRIFAEWK
jgi:hypothetical protein